MKKRILSMLLVLCMVISVLPMTAFAEDVQVQFRLNNVEGEGKAASIVETITPSDTILYYTTNENKEFVAWAGAEAPTATDKYIKVSYPVAEEAVLYVTLNNIDAVNSTTEYGDQYHAIYFGEGAYAVVLTLQGENSIATGTNACIHTCAANGTTITGSGSLTLYSAAAPGCITVRKGDLLIKNTTLDITNDGTSWRHAILHDGFDNTVTGDQGSNNLVIDGATITATTKTGAFVMFGNIRGAANGSATSDGYSDRTLHIKDSNITAITATGGSVFRTRLAPVIEYTNMTISCSTSSNRLFYKSGPVLIGVKAVGSQYEDGRNPETFDAENYTKYRYMKTTADVKVKFNLNNAEGEGKAESINATIAPSDTTLYYTTNENKEFVAWTGTEAPTATDKYIKVTYPVADEAIVYVTLNNIDVVNSTTNYGDPYHAIYFGDGAYSVVLTLQGENSIETGTNACIHTCAANGTTITGSGSLTMTSTAAPGCITARKGNLLIKDTTLDFTNTSSSWRHAILLDGFDGVAEQGSNSLTIDGATITANTKSGGLVFFGKITGTNTHGGGTTDNLSTRTLHIKDSTITAITATGGSVFRTNTTPVIEYSNITASCSVSSQRLFRVTPMLIGMEMIGSQWADGRTPETYNKTSYTRYRYIKTTAITEHTVPTLALNELTPEVTDLKATLVDTSSVAFQMGVKVLPLNSGVTAADLTGWKSFTDLAGKNLNGKPGYTNLGLAQSVNIVEDGDYVFYVMYKDAEKVTKTAFYVFTVDNFDTAVPAFTVSNNTATLNKNGLEVIQSGVKFVGKDADVNVNMLTWGSFTGLSGTSLTGKAGYTNLGTAETAELTLNGDYVFYIIYKDAQGATKTIFSKLTAEVETPDFEVSGGTATLKDNDFEIVQSGVKFVGMNSNVDVVTVSSWNAFTSLTGTALNGRLNSYTNLGTAETAALTAEGDYVFYIIYKDAEQVTRTIYLLKTV